MDAEKLLEQLNKNYTDAKLILLLVLFLAGIGAVGLGSSPIVLLGVMWGISAIGVAGIMIISRYERK